tara:strand:- start:479 stop:1201 length:723 start_codon:yes stop_codon:yes gene_type:complete
MTIDEVYRLVQAFANKEQRGFITPSEFNLLAKQAELELYNKRLAIVMEKSQPKKTAGFYNESLSPTLAKQDLSHFLRIASIGFTNDTKPYLGTASLILADYIESIFINNDEEHSISTNIPVEIVNNVNINQILRSSLVKPSIEYPIALLSESGVNKKISIFPETIKDCVLYYYLNDNTPKWGYVTISGKPVYDHSSSTQFKLSQRCHGELVTKILEYLGVSIREAEVVQYAQNKEAIQDN